MTKARKLDSELYTADFKQLSSQILLKPSNTAEEHHKPHLGESNRKKKL